MTPTRAFVGLGSNLDGPVGRVQRALMALSALRATRLVHRSNLYLSAPLGPPGQPDYVNAVAALDTTLPPLALLDALFAIEQAQGRERTIRWGARTLDLDLLLYGSLVLQSERLTLPHPAMGERNFVLVPLAEIAPDLVFPDGTPIDALLARCPSAGLRRLDEPPAAP